jgi:hypothetical protein
MLISWSILSVVTASRVTELTDAAVQFGLIPNDHWVQPPHIDEAKATESREKMVKDNVIYGGECFGLHSSIF